MSLLRIFGLVAFQHTPLGHVVGEGSISIKAIVATAYTRQFEFKFRSVVTMFYLSVV
jgi:hypothetical protein